MSDDFRPARRPLGRRVSGWISRGTEKVDSYRTPLGLAVLAIGAFLAYTAFKATTGPPFLPEYKITVKVASDAPPLRKGQAVRVGGSLAGLIKDVRPDPKNGLTLVQVNLSKTAFRPLPADTTAFVRVHSIVYETYLGLQPGTSKQKLKDGDTLAAVARSGTDLLEVVQLFDKQAREDLSKTLVNAGFGLAGRGRDLNQALRDLPATSRYLGDQLRAATATRGALARLVSGGARTASGLRGRRPDDVGALIASGDRTFAATASRSAQLQEAIARLRPFEDEVLRTAPVATPALDEVARTATSLRPVLRNLRAQLPDLNRLATRGDALRTGFAALLGGGASGSAGGGGGGSVGTGTSTDGIANQVLVAARPVVRGLYPIQTALGPLNRSLATLLATVTPYLADIDQAGRRLQNATSIRYGRGSKPNAPALRLVPVLSGHPCQNPQPAPGDADKDKTINGACR